MKTCSFEMKISHTSHSSSPCRPRCHLSRRHPPSASPPAWSPTPPSSPAATAAASRPSAAAACRRLRALSCLQVTTRPTRCPPPPPCRTLSRAARTSQYAGRIRPLPPTACTRGTTPAGPCRCPTVSPSRRRRTPRRCRPSLTSSALAAWSWTEPLTPESPDQDLCPGRCPSYRCWFRSRSGEETHWRILHFSTRHSMFFFCDLQFGIPDLHSNKRRWPID